jgi:hypothetical protein
MNNIALHAQWAGDFEFAQHQYDKLLTESLGVAISRHFEGDQVTHLYSLLAMRGFMRSPTIELLHDI